MAMTLALFAPSPSRVGLLIAFLASAAVALAALERGRPRLAAVFKPLTTALLLAIVGWPVTTFGALVWAGVIASLAGDVALLRDGSTAFLVGLGFFLVAHLTYVVAFVTAGVWSAASWAGLLLVSVVTPLLLRTLWPAVGGGLRGPVIAYAAAISAMVVGAFSTVGGPLPAAPLAAIGAVFFYASDTSLAVNRFVRPIPHASLYSVGLYWLGQLGIALAAHGRAP